MRTLWNHFRFAKGSPIPYASSRGNHSRSRIVNDRLYGGFEVVRRIMTADQHPIQSNVAVDTVR